MLFLFIAGCRENSRKEAAVELNTSDTLHDSTQADVPIGDFNALIRKYEDPERVNWQNPDMVLEKMGDLSGKVVADIGVGTGYFAFRIVRKGGTVIGIDIEKRFLDYIQERKSDLPEELSDQIITRLTVPDDPNLQENEADWVLIVNTYNFLDDRAGYLKKTLRGIKPGGKFLVVDFKAGDLPVGPNNEKITLAQAVEEIRSAGFTVLETDKNSLQYQYIIVAKK